MFKDCVYRVTYGISILNDVLNLRYPTTPDIKISTTHQKPLYRDIIKILLDEGKFQISSSYSVPKLRYRPLPL